jgi:hypothetical protein
MVAVAQSQGVGELRLLLIRDRMPVSLIQQCRTLVSEHLGHAHRILLPVDTPAAARRLWMRDVAGIVTNAPAVIRAACDAF